MDEKSESFETPGWLKGLGRALNETPSKALGPCPEPDSLAKALEEQGDPVLLDHLARCPACQAQRLEASAELHAPSPARLEAILSAARQARGVEAPASPSKRPAVTVGASGALERKGAASGSSARRSFLASVLGRRVTSVGIGLAVALAVMFWLRRPPEAELVPWTSGSLTLETGAFRSEVLPDAQSPLRLTPDRPWVVHWQPGTRVASERLPSVRAFLVQAAVQQTPGPVVELGVTPVRDGAALRLTLAPPPLPFPPETSLWLVLAVGRVADLEPDALLAPVSAVPAASGLTCFPVEAEARSCLWPQPLIVPPSGSAP